MLRETIHASVDTNVELETSKLRERCLAVGLDGPNTDLLVSETAAVLSNLVDQGRRIASVGSQMEATRELRGDGYIVRLVFRQGVKQSFVQRFFEKLKGL
jgi:hypothetical protein